MKINGEDLSILKEKNSRKTLLKIVITFLLIIIIFTLYEFFFIFKIKSNYDFAGFVDEIQNYVYARVENDPFTLKLIASLYIITLAGEDVITVFDMLNAQDANELLQAGKGILYDSDIQNVSTMFAWLHQGELVR